MKELFIHIGYTKTATCFIQNTLFKNRLILADHDILYPAEDIHKQAHHDLANSLQEEFHYLLSKKTNFKELIQNLINESENSHCSKIMISSEQFYKAGKKQIQKLAESLTPYFRIKIIVYFRRQDDWLESAYNQVIKANAFSKGLSFEEFIKERFHQLDYYRLIQDWEEYFGQGNVLPVLYHKSKDVIKELFKRIDMNFDTTLLKISDLASNKSPDFYTLSLLDHFKSENMSRAELKLIQEYCERLTPNELKISYTLWNSHTRSKLLKSLFHSNKQLSIKYNFPNLNSIMETELRTLPQVPEIDFNSISTKLMKLTLSQYKDKISSISFSKNFLIKRWSTLLYSENIKRVVLFGAGVHTKWLLKTIKNLNGPKIIEIIDEKPSTFNCKLWNKPVRDLNSLKNLNFDAVILSTDIHYENMRRSIKNTIEPCKTIFLYESIMSSLPLEKDI